MKRFIISILIIIVVFNSLALSLFFFFHSHTSFAQIRNRRISDIEQQVVKRLESFNILIKPFEEQAKKYNERLLHTIFTRLKTRTEGAPFSADNALLSELSDQYEGFNIYLIDRSGVVEKSSFEKDIGINLLEMNKSFTDFITSIYGSGQTYTQRLSISNMQGTKMIYSYFSPEGSDWILETSVAFDDFIRENYSEMLYTHLFHDFFSEIAATHSNITNFDIMYGTNISTRSLISGEEITLKKAVTRSLRQDSSYREREVSTLHIYRTQSMERAQFDFVQYPIIYLEYDLSPYYNFLIQFYLIAGLSIFLFVTIFSAFAYKIADRKLVKRVEELDQVLQKAVAEKYENRVSYTSRIPELMNLAQSANKLIAQVQERESDLKSALKERETLLAEIHHRVKNNLNVVISLLNLQDEQVQTIEDVRNALQKTKNRIYSIALTHEKLYHSEDFTDVNMKDYFETFLDQFKTTIEDTVDIDIKTSIDEVNLSITYAVPCGIILNELLTNAVTHAFHEGDTALVTISFSKSGTHRYILTVEDNGIGLPETFTIEKSSSLGLILVDTLIRQIDGTLRIEGREKDRHKGARFEIIFDVKN